jgi:PPOX class F420-dependent enzyme/OxyR family protein
VRTRSRHRREGGRPLASFSAAELNYLLGERRLGRLATADPTGQPHVVPVGWRYNPELGTIDVSGRNFAATKKFRNVKTNPQAAFVVDDVLPPWRPRSVMVQGRAQALEVPEHSGAGGGGGMIRIIPDKIVAWGLQASDR